MQLKLKGFIFHGDLREQIIDALWFCFRCDICRTAVVRACLQADRRSRCSHPVLPYAGHHEGQCVSCPCGNLLHRSSTSNVGWVYNTTMCSKVLSYQESLASPFYYKCRLSNRYMAHGLSLYSSSILLVIRSLDPVQRTCNEFIIPLVPFNKPLTTCKAHSWHYFLRSPFICQITSWVFPRFAERNPKMTSLARIRTRTLLFALFQNCVFAVC